ncbi:MAG: rhodanese-like domain-containing protein [Alphaproteobacteria bacterium]
MNGNFVNFLIAAIAAYCLLFYVYPYLRRLLRGRDVIYIEPEMLAEQMDKKKDMLLIDVRSSSEFYNMFGHIDGAINLPFSEFMIRINETADRLAGFKEIPVVIIGLRDENSVFKAYQILKQKGFSDVSILNYGISKWLRQGLPTVERNVRKV